MVKLTSYSLLTVAFLLGVIFFPVSATQDSPHPVLDITDKKYQAPIDLASESLEDLFSLRDFYLKEIETVTQEMEVKTDQKKLFKALLEYDLKRLEIIEVIPQIIKAYNIQGIVRQDLVKYSDTFQRIHKNHRPKLETLDDYKSYDFRIGIAYASMLAMIMSSDKGLYQRLQHDMTDNETAIGSYVLSLDQSYGNVEKVNYEIREFHLMRQINRELKRINQEIESR